ncbi:MAG: class I SAM-dependent RNA methyltransferase, partial [Fulvivirga sp.]|nr:class I SAM-dependent RNA methyltransferase [Fulvivirga sp.]
MFNAKIVLTCAPRLAPYLQDEIENLGYDAKITGNQSVETTGNFNDCLTFNLHLSTANRVLFHLKSFKAAGPDELYAALKKLAWHRYIPHNGYIHVNGFVKNDQIRDTRFAYMRAKDAIVDKIFSEKNQRPDAGPLADKTVIFLHWINHNASIYIDTSGETIAKHGYRKIPYKAPMMESLAAATLMATRWNKDQHLVNPMCGSGTIAIEAALMATNTPPGFFRHNFGFMHTKLFDRNEWMQIKEAAKERLKRKIDFKIIANDIDPKALEAARHNAKAAGVDHLIEFQQGDFSEVNLPENEKGIIFFNPEYGQRLGEEERLKPLYKNIGDFMKKSAHGYMGYVFTGNLQLAKK